MRFAVFMMFLASCGRDTADPDAFLDHDAPPGVRDVRVRVPVPSDDKLDLITPEVVIQPGEERMLCVHLRNDRGDLAVDWVDGVQGAYGHHIALFSTTNPQPPGTLVECTSSEANAEMQWFAFNVTFPSGKALKIPRGMPYVVQFHYINAGEVPILVRDVETLHLVDRDSVRTWVSTLMSTDLILDVVPGTSTVSWDCTIAEDRDVLQLFGHMHELGSKYTLEMGPDPSSLSVIETLDPYLPSYRDAPKVHSYFDHPLRIPGGSTLRTTCTWTNRTDRTVSYPAEMCTTFMYVAAESQYTCQPEH